MAGADRQRLGHIVRLMLCAILAATGAARGIDNGMYVRSPIEKSPGGSGMKGGTHRRLGYSAHHRRNTSTSMSSSAESRLISTPAVQMASTSNQGRRAERQQNGTGGRAWH